MKLPENEIVVLDIAGDRALIVCGQMLAEPTLRELGFLPDGTQMVRPISGDLDRKAITRKLINLGALFSNGKDWSPAELVDLYRDQGEVTDPYKVITWRNPDHYFIVLR